jgi:hypothetical protein
MDVRLTSRLRARGSMRITAFLVFGDRQVGEALFDTS